MGEEVVEAMPGVMQMQALPADRAPTLFHYYLPGNIESSACLQGNEWLCDSATAYTPAPTHLCKRTALLLHQV